MDPSAKLYALEPNSQRLLRWTQSAVSALIAFYWTVFQLWGFLFLGLLAVPLMVAGVSEIRLPSHRWYLAVPSIALGVSCFVSVRVRRFAWAFFAEATEC